MEVWAEKSYNDAVSGEGSDPRRRMDAARTGGIFHHAPYPNRPRMNTRVKFAIRVGAGAIQRYAKRDGFYARLVRDPKRLAEFLKRVGNFFSTRPVTAREVEKAIEIARGLVDAEKGLRKAAPDTPEHDIEVLQRADLARRRQINDKLQESEVEIFTPGSSNVYSFSFTPESRTRGILYVTFRQGKPTHYEWRTNKTTGKRYRCGIKPFEQGPMYAYYDVPIIVYNRLKAAHSTGEAVWDMLRIRGSVYGHQYRYTLVEGAKLESGEVYVPRRATAEGFKRRAVALTGEFTGASGGVLRRRFQTSKLPSVRRRFRTAENDVHHTAAKRFRGG